MNSRLHQVGVCFVIFATFLTSVGQASHKSGDDPNGKGDSNWKSDSPKDGFKSKGGFDKRSLGALREQMQVTDAEWDALLPRITKVQMLAKQLYDLRNPQKAGDPVKLPKANKDNGNGNGNGNGNSVAPPTLPFYLTDLSDKARELKNIMADTTARPADIEWRLAAFRKARATAEAELVTNLTRARAELTELLTARQELVCVMSGLLQ
jgi:hypothetical protein